MDNNELDYMRKMIASMGQVEDEVDVDEIDFDEEFSPEEVKALGLKVTRKRKSTVKKPEAILKEPDIYEKFPYKIDTSNITVNILQPSHDMKYKEQEWNIADVVREYHIFSVKGMEEIRALAANGCDKEEIEEEIEEVKAGRAQWFKVVYTKEAIQVGARKVAYIIIRSVDGKIGYRIKYVKGAAKALYTSSAKVSEEVKKAAIEMCKTAKRKKVVQA